MLKENSASYLITTNHKIDFMKSDICENVLPDHHKIVYSFLRKSFATGKPESLIKFIDEVISISILIFVDLSFEAFLKIYSIHFEYIRSL